MREVPEDNYIKLYYKDTPREEFDKLLEEENSRYTINGKVLNTKAKVAHDLSAIRIHVIDFGFDEFDSESFQYITEEIDRCRLDLDSGNVVDAAVRVVCMQLLLGIDINMKTVIKAVSMNKLGLPEEFYGEVPQKMLRNLVDYGDDGNKKIPEVFSKNPDEDGSLKKRRGK